MNTPDFEHQIGIEAYYTPEPGIGGKLRVRIDDFKVTELFSHPPKKDNGNFTVAEVEARNWETHTLALEIADRLRLSPRQISFAGTKDKRAVSVQLMSFDRVSTEKISGLNIKDVSFKNIYQTDTPVRIGDLLGNRFSINVRNIDAVITPGQVKKLLSHIETSGGFPNFYGIQRFGVMRPITHLVGKHIIHGRFEEAVMTYVAHPLKGENETTYVVREQLEKTRNYAEAYQSYPDSMNFEKSMLSVLRQNPTDFIGALLMLPKNLLMMFVNAYESFLFNKILSERIRRKIPIHQAIEGDIVSPVKKNLVTDEYISVTSVNINKVNTQLAGKKAVVTGLLAGYDTRYASGEMGEIEHTVIESEKLNLKDFTIPEIPWLSSSGERRSLLCILPSLEWKLHADDLYEDKQALTLQFELYKGCYATTLLREIMKSPDPKNY